MHVLLVGAELEENLAVRYLAASLEKAGHSAEIAPFGSLQDLPAVLGAAERKPPELIGLSKAFQRRAPEFGTLSETLRAWGYRGHITCGGHFPTFAYKELLRRYPSLDSVVRHEGEITLVELCQALENKGPGAELETILGLAYRQKDGTVRCNSPRPLVEDLDAIAFPKRCGPSQVHMGIPAAFLVGSRGCYGHCTFCCIHAYIQDAGGPKYRARSAENVADEIAELRHSRGARMLVFHDDDFFTRDHERDLARVTALRDALQKRAINDIALVVKARPDDVDPRVFEVLKQIGLLRVYLGIEAGCTQGLRTLGRGVDLQRNQQALDYLRAIGVYTCFNMLIFDPDSTCAALRQSLGFLQSCTEVPMNFCRTEVYVGTPLMHRLERQGRLRGDVFGWDYEIAEPAAERAFRLFCKGFYDRNFRCDGLMNSNLGLGYHLHLLKHFYPRAMSSPLEQQVFRVIRAVNQDCVDNMLRIVAFAETPQSAEEPAFEDFGGTLCDRMQKANQLLEEQVAETTARITRAAAGQSSQKSSMPMWQRVAAATLALSPLACDPLAPPPPPDPLPPPERTGTATEQNRYAQPPPTDTAQPPPSSIIVDPPPPPDPLPPPTTTRPHPRDPLPPPTTSQRRHYPPPDPPPPPTGRKPHSSSKPVPPADPPPPPTAPYADPLPPPERSRDK